MVLTRLRLCCRKSWGDSTEAQAPRESSRSSPLPGSWGQRKRSSRRRAGEGARSGQGPAQEPHPEGRDQVGQAVPQVGVVSEGVVGEEGRHGGAPAGGVEHQHQHRHVCAAAKAKKKTSRLRPRRAPRLLEDTGRVVHVGLRGVKVGVCVEQLGDQRQHQGGVAGAQELQAPAGREDEDEDEAEAGLGPGPGPG